VSDRGTVKSGLYVFGNVAYQRSDLEASTNALLSGGIANVSAGAAVRVVRAADGVLVWAASIFTVSNIAAGLASRAAAVGS
jgi:hypothetical protein